MPKLQPATSSKAQGAVTPLLKSTPLKTTPPPSTLPVTATQTNQPYSNPSLTGTGIQLTGSFNPQQKAIADKYSIFYKSPISVSVVSSLLGSQDPTAAGLEISKADGSRTVQVKNNLDPDAFEFTLLHEIGHQIFHYNEDGANAYAHRMLNLNIK